MYSCRMEIRLGSLGIKPMPYRVDQEPKLHIIFNFRPTRLIDFDQNSEFMVPIGWRLPKIKSHFFARTCSFLIIINTLG